MSEMVRKGIVGGLRKTMLGGLAGLLALAAALACGAGPAAAAEPAVSWHIETEAPTYLVPPRGVSYEIVATNLGTGSAAEATITDRLPAALEFKSVGFFWSGLRPEKENLAKFGLCSQPAAQEVSCTFKLAQIQPGQQLRMTVEAGLRSSTSEGPVLDEAAVSGGGAAVSTVTQSTVSSHPAFGISGFTMQTTEVQAVSPAGEPSRLLAPSASEPRQPLVNKPTTVTQAGAHPQALTTMLQFASMPLNEGSADGEGFGNEIVPVEDPKDAVVDLPPGLLGDPQAVPRCSLPKVLADSERCPADTQVGVAKLIFFDGHESLAPIVDLTPEAGQSAVFGLETSFKITFILTAHVVRVHAPAPGEPGKEQYGLTVASNGISITALHTAELTFWGVPAEPRNDPLRGLVCRNNDPVNQEKRGCEGGNEPSGAPAVPFLTLPADCAAGPEAASVRADSWEEPGSVHEGKYDRYVEASAQLPGASGCGALAFEPTIEALPDTLLADEPVGLGVNVKVPQSEEPASAGTPQLRNAVVTLPAGLSISPGIVDGIQACDESGPEGINFSGPESEEVGSSGELQLAPGHCPNASTIGEAEAETPLLPEPIKGHVYLARPACGGAGQSACTEEDALDGKLYRLYLELGGSGALANAGVNIKVEGKVEANPATGQLTAKFLENPQFPFSELRIRLNGGPRAPLDTPATCGPATTTADFTPWSAPGTTPEGVLMPGVPDATPSSFFDVQGCASPPPLHPGFLSGTTSAQAGKFSAFTMSLTRQDREQFVKGIQIHTPPGLVGMLSSVPLCSGDQADDPALYGECTASKIGTVRVASGAGSHPFEIEGNVYLTGPYEGAPFGLSIVTHVVAGPFDLGLVVVRARIDVNPENSTLTVTADETGPYALPQIIFGVPLRLQRIAVDIDRPGFMFNPTNCQPRQVSATVSGIQQTIAEVSSRFQAANCASLAFEPTFKASTSAHTSRRDGASLHVSVTYPKGAIGKDANLQYARVELPKALPSQLETLKKACLESVFDANPANCPIGSVVGHALVHTPVLPVPLQGPAYFVSHGGREFPSLTVVLQGDGVTVDLVGATFISKGVTSSTFSATPDVPFESFELTLPQGADPALAANGNLCDQKLIMPTHFIAQNGATLQQQSRIAVQGCPGGLKVLSKRVKGDTLKLRVVVPAAGTLKASGQGLSSAGKSASGREPLTLTLHASARAGSHPEVKLAFKPARGKEISTALSLS